MPMAFATMSMTALALMHVACATVQEIYIVGVQACLKARATASQTILDPAASAVATVQHAQDTDSGACNYEPTAIIDAGCEYETCAGCTYEFACNYDPEATISCQCEFGTCPGCTDFNACNYNPTVTEDDGSCQYIDECGICGGDGIPAATAIAMETSRCPRHLWRACEADVDLDNITTMLIHVLASLTTAALATAGAIYDCGCSDIPAREWV